MPLKRFCAERAIRPSALRYIFPWVGTIILLRALGRPQSHCHLASHTALKTSSRKIRERISRFFYKRALIICSRSVKNLLKKRSGLGKLPKKSFSLWVLSRTSLSMTIFCKQCHFREPEGFISTGKENLGCRQNASSFLRHRSTTGLVHSPHQWKCKLPTDY